MAGRTLSEIGERVDLSWYILKGKMYQIVNTREKLMQVLPFIRDAKLVGFDTETTGLQICDAPWGSKNKDHCVGLCLSYTKNQGLYIPLDHTLIENMPMKYVVKHLFPLLETVPLATHNGIFDYKVMYDMGCKLNILHDSMILVFNIFSKVAKGSKKLKLITRWMYHDETIDFEDIFENTSDYTKFREVSEEVCRIYGCADADYARQIVIDNFNFLDQRQQICYMRDVSYIPLIAVAEYHGKPIDLTILPEKLEACKQNIKNLEDMFFNYVGWKMTGDLNERYKFSTTSHVEMADLFFNVLGYEPVYTKNSEKISVDKFVRKRLMSRNREDNEVDEFLKIKYPKGLVNLLSLEEDREVEEEKLVSFEKVKHKDCVPAFILEALSKQQKELTSFFNKITKESDSESGKYYSGISMTNTETSRLVDFLQTLDGDLKYLVATPNKKKKYMYVFDFSQIEYRVMAAIAKMGGLCNKLDNTHVDFHVECAALILGLLPENITSRMRKKYKSINFAIPYGMAEDGLISSMFGIGLTDEEEKAALKEVKEMFALWKASMGEIMDMLNGYRKIAQTPRPYNHPLVQKSVETTSYIHTPDGRVRVFDLKDMSQAVLNKIARKSGNTPIQALARTIYLMSIKNFYDTMIEAGLADVKVEDANSPSGYSYTSKVTINGFVHDEIFGFVDNDVNPKYLYKVIREKCMKKYDGHPTYYCGIAICNNWYEGKHGIYEAPIDFVDAVKSDQMIVEPRENWPEVIAKEMTEWVNNSSMEYVESLADEALTKNGILDADKVLSLWKDYYYKKHITTFGTGAGIIKSQSKDDEDGKLMDKVVGTLLATKYESVTLVWWSRNLTKLIHRNQSQQIKEEAKREQDVLQEQFSKFVAEDLSDEDIGDLDLIVNDNEDYEDANAPVNVNANVGVLETFLFR